MRRRKQRVSLRKKSRELRNRRARRFLLWSLAFFVIFSGVRWSMSVTGQWFLSDKFLTLKEIRVQGALKSLSQQELLSALPVKTGDSLLAARRKDVAQVLKEKFPQFRDVRVRTMLWGTMVIRIWEREPVAQMHLPDGLHAMDAQGVLYAAVSVPEGLPELIPCEPQALSVAARFLQLAKKEGIFQDLGIASVGIEAPHDDIFFFLKDGTKVCWGAFEESSLAEKYRRLRWVMDQVALKNGGLSYANLRYYDEGKIIVKPKETTEGDSHGKI